MTVIDAHHHLWDLNRRPQTWLDGPEMAAIRRDFTVADLEAAVTEAGVDQTVLVQVLADATETTEFLATAADCDRIAGVVGWTDLTSPRVAENLEALRDAPGGEFLVGIRHLVQGEADPNWLTRPDVLNGLRSVAAHRLAYDVLVLPHQLPAAIAAARAVPELTFVLDHAAKPPIASGLIQPWAARINELAAEANVYCKLSGLVTEADHTRWTVEDLRPYSDIVLEAFGPSRVMFGSDWPVCELAAPYGRVAAITADLTAGLTVAERDELYGGTAIRAYRLNGGRL